MQERSSYVTVIKKATVKVPAGTQSGQILKLRGKGMTVVRSSIRGDMFVHVNVETPVNLTEHQKELLREFVSQISSEIRRLLRESKGILAGIVNGCV